MMSDEAWNDLMVDVRAMLDATNDISSIQDEKSLHFKRGEISIMRWLLNLHDVSQEAYQQLQKETYGKDDA